MIRIKRKENISLSPVFLICFRCSVSRKRCIKRHVQHLLLDTSLLSTSFFVSKTFPIDSFRFLDIDHHSNHCINNRTKFCLSACIKDGTYRVTFELQVWSSGFWHESLQLQHFRASHKYSIECLRNSWPPTLDVQPVVLVRGLRRSWTPLLPFAGASLGPIY